MTSPFADSTLGMPGSATGVCAKSGDAIPLEAEVVDMFEQFRNRLLRYLLALGLNAHDGEEVIQEVFLALFQHLQRGKSRHNLRSWIFRVAHNLGLKQRNRDRRRVQEIVEAGDLAREHIDPSPNPEEQLLNKDRSQRLRTVLNALPEKDRWCLYLRAEVLRYREIAEVLGISYRSFRHLMKKYEL